MSCGRLHAIRGIAFADAVFREAKYAYRQTVGKRDKKRLKRIADASNRTETTAGGENAS